jgi:hypothetical protein
MVNGARAARRTRWRKAGSVLLTVFLLIAPFGTLIMAIYGARRLYADRRRRPEAYTWLALRSVARSYVVAKFSLSGGATDLSIASS